MRILLLAVCMLGFGFKGTKMHSTLAPTVKVNGDSIDVKVKVIPNKDLVMNYEGPWNLKVVNAGGLKGAPERLTLKDFDRTNQEFKFTAKTGGLKKGEMKLQVAVFVCVEDKKTKEKTECFRDVHDQTVKWGA